MARKDKDRGSSRKTEGGIRKTEFVRDLSPRSGSGRTSSPSSSPLDAIGGSFFKPDLSAWETPDISTPRPILADRVNVSPVRQATLQRAAPAALAANLPSRDYVQRAAARKALLYSSTPGRFATLTSALSKRTPMGQAPMRKPTTLTLNTVKGENRPNQSKLESPKHSPAKPSPPAREVRAQTDCKPRPKTNKPHGKGGSRKTDFAPWCEVRNKR